MGEENKGKSGCCSVIIVFCMFLMVGLDVVAGFLAMQAEVAQQEVDHTREWFLECKSPSKKAFVLGIIALGCFLAAHIIAIMIGCRFSNTVTVLTLPKITENINMACITLTWIVATAQGGYLRWAYGRIESQDQNVDSQTNIF